MEDSNTTGRQTSRLRRIIRATLFTLAALTWIAELLYLIAARVDPLIPVSWITFLAGAAAIQIFFIPALILAFPREKYSPRRVLVAFWLIVTSVFWVFAPLYEYLALYDTSRAGVLTLMMNYLWEVPAIGALTLLPLYFYFKRLVSRVIRLPQYSTEQRAILRRQLSRFPIISALSIITLAAVGLAVGLTIARFQIMPPPYEMIKSVADVMTMGILAATLFFFVQGEIIRPWLERLPTGKPSFPLKRKLALIVIVMSFFAFVVYVPVAYKHSQEVLGRRIVAHAHTVLANIAEQLPESVSAAQFSELSNRYSLDTGGYIIAIDAQGNIVSPHPKGLIHLSQELRWSDHIDALRSGSANVIISHYKDTRYVVAHPWGAYRLIAFVPESGFLSELTPLLWKTLIIGLIFGGIFAVLAWLFIRGIANPIAKVTAAAQKIAGHHRPAPVKVGTGDEIEVLAAQVTEMGVQIRDYEENLEQKIAARTAEIKEVNADLKQKTRVLERVLTEVKKVDEELARVNHAKTEFLSMASHQLRTPLTTIKWYAAILAKAGGLKRLTPKQRRALYHMRQANERMIELMNILLNLSRLEMGTLKIQPERANLSAFAKKCLEEVKALAAKRGVRIQAAALPKNLTARIDPNLLNIIVNNLLANAINYTPKGGLVALNLQRSKKFAIMKVTDTGYGIPKAEQGRIFEKFYRASNVREKEPAGTGLGLYLTKRLAEMLKAQVGFTSTEGKGSEFWVKIPHS